MLWPRAYKCWNAKSEEEKKKILYPSIDEWFMNLLDYVSQFGLMFAAMPDAESVYKNSGLKNMKDLYAHEIDSSRIEVYKEEENVIKLFRILDLLVDIYRRCGVLVLSCLILFAAILPYVWRKRWRDTGVSDLAVI